jgi:hypothetical protein
MGNRFGLRAALDDGADLDTFEATPRRGGDGNASNFNKGALKRKLRGGAGGKRRRGKR